MKTIYLYGFLGNIFSYQLIELAISNVISITACLFFRVNFTHVLNDLFCLSATTITKEPFLPSPFIGDNSVQFLEIRLLRQ
jgi:hypothetical protein